MGFSGEYSFFFLRREVRDAESAFFRILLYRLQVRNLESVGLRFLNMQVFFGEIHKNPVDIPEFRFMCHDFISPREKQISSFVSAIRSASDFPKADLFFFF